MRRYIWCRDQQALSLGQFKRSPGASARHVDRFFEHRSISLFLSLLSYTILIKNRSLFTSGYFLSLSRSADAQRGVRSAAEARSCCFRYSFKSKSDTFDGSISLREFLFQVALIAKLIYNVYRYAHARIIL